MPPIAFSRMDEPTHVVLGDSAASNFLHHGLDVITLRDLLSWGPSHTDPARHAELRAAFWSELYAGDWNAMRRRTQGVLKEGMVPDRFSDRQLIDPLAARPRNRPVLLWTVRAWQERLNFWWVLDAIQRAGFDLDRFWIVQLPPLGDSLIESLACFPVDSLTAALPLREPLTGDLLNAGAEVWRKFASSSPAEFDEARRRGSPLFPDLPDVAGRHCWLFPQVTTAGRSLWGWFLAPIIPLRRHLWVSLLDQVFFDRLSPDVWRRPVDLLQDLDFLGYLLAIAWDQLAPQRLWAWANHNPNDPAVISRPIEGVNDHTNVEYRLTPRGERIRRDGLESASEAPPMWAGGCRVYDGENPWVRVVDGDRWRIERFTA